MITIGLSQNKKVINLAILGGTGGCYEILALINRISKKYKNIKFEGFFEDNIDSCNSLVKKNYLGNFRQAKDFKNKNLLFCTAIGSEKNFVKKKNKIAMIGISETRYLNIIDPDIDLPEDTKLGYGNIFFRGCYIGKNVSFKNMNLILPNVIVSHDCSFGSYNIINAACNFSGNVIVKNSNYFGANVSVKPYLEIGSKNLFGMSSTLVKNIKDGRKIYDKRFEINHELLY